MPQSAPSEIVHDKPAKPRRVVVVVQRYGIEINGGAELHARQVALQLSKRHHVTILTSCALDYTDWAMHYGCGEHTVEGLLVRRFAHPPRNDIGRARVPRPHKMRFKLRRLLDALPGPRVPAPRDDAEYDGLNYLRRQGPHCPDLLRHLVQSQAEYDIAVFFTALYEPTAVGLPAWGRRSLLVPTLHDEKAMALPHFHRVFAAAGHVLYNTAAEQRLARALYGGPPGTVVGLGISVQAPTAAGRADTCERLRLPERYVVYVGRIDTAKGCDELIAAVLAAYPETGLPLVLVGKAFMPLPEHPAIVATGFVADADRDAIVAGAWALIVPSRYESLSMVLLEAMTLGVPVVANARCEVLADHVLDSGAGLLYRSPRQLRGTLHRLAAESAAQREAWGRAGAAYVAARYSWDRVMAQYEDAIARVCGD
jgi:glycosyltransferase involved in cell wall biosynthesis